MRYTFTCPSFVKHAQAKIQFSIYEFVLLLILYMQFVACNLNLYTKITAINEHEMSR